MDCVAIVDGRHTITVNEWYEHNKFRTHNVQVFRDDTVMRAVLKVAAALGKTTIPYVWHKRQSLLFTVRSTNWNGYRVHPWEALTDGTETMRPTIVYRYGELIGAHTQTINVAFRDACPFANNDHFFPSIEQAVPSAQVIRREDAVLEKLLSYDNSEHAKILKRDSSCVYSHVVFRGKPHKFDHPQTFLSDLYKRLHVGAFVPFIQWMNDSVQILYKLAEHHSISVAHIAHWTASERLPKVPTCITMYSPVATNNNVFARIFITQDGEVVVTYHMNIREKVDWSAIVAHKNKVFEWLRNFTGINYEVLDGTDISVRAELITNVATVELLSVVSSILPIFHVLVSKAGYIELLYKRSSNYKDEVQLSEYIQTKISMGIPVPEIVESLVEMGIDREEVLANIDSPAPNAKKIQTGTVIKIAKIGHGLSVSVVNCPSIAEVQMALNWLRACIIHVPHAIKKPQRRAPSLSSSSSAAAPVPVAAVSSSSKTTESSVKSDDLAFLSDGGAIGKENQRYFLSMLQDADPALFNNSDINYARTCQASSFHQPVVLSKDEYDKMVDEGFGEAVDNSVTYGSDPSRKNVYFCPRIWCPVSKRPITYEMYVRNGNKCPSGESAKLMYEHPYWNNSPNTKHYIGFHKKKTNDGLCLPCCYAKPLAKDKEKECTAPVASPAAPADPSSPATAQVKDAYIMTQVAPLPEGRNGNIPQVLHEIITPNVNFQLCTKTLSSQECPVRRGIAHKGDSLMNAIAYAVGKGSKEQLIEWLKKELDPLTFLSLENGEIVATFTDVNGPVPRDHIGLVKEMRVRLRKWPKYREIFNIDVATLDADQYKMSRELQLYIAWLRYFKYLSSNEVKSPHHLYDVLKKLGYLLVVWDKEGTNDIQLRCPLYTSVATLARAIDEHRKTIMLLYENGVYEPIELKKRTNNGVPVMDTKYTSTIDDVIGACKAETEDATETAFKRVVTVENWALHMLRHGAPFTFHVAVISPDLRISHIFTKGHVLVHLPNGGLPIGLLPRILKETHTKHVVYHEDIAGKVYTARLFKVDADLYARKLKSVGFGYSMGVIGTTAGAGVGYINTLLTVPVVATPPTIVVRGSDELGSFERAESKLDTEWVQVQRMVGKVLIQHYDSLVAPLLQQKSTRKDRIDILMNTFPAFPNKRRLRAVFEEMPFENGKEAMMTWVRLVGYESMFPFFADDAKLVKGEWIFSQRAVDVGLPSEVMIPVKKNGHRPRNEILDNKAERIPFTKQDVVNVAEVVPDMIKEVAVDKKKLPSKWTQIRNYEWSKYYMYVVKRYTRDCCKELIEWIGKQLGIPIFWGDIQYMKSKYVIGALFDEPSALMLLEDPSFAQEWAMKLGKSMKTPKQIWDRGLSKLTREDAVTMWKDIAENGRLWPADIDIFVAAKLMDVTIMVLHRSKYGAGAAKRGDIEDLATSSALYTLKYDMTHVRNRPICILYKDTESDHSVYSAITDQKGVFLFSSLFDCPLDIKKLVEHHIQVKGRG